MRLFTGMIRTHKLAEYELLETKEGVNLLHTQLLVRFSISLEQTIKDEAEQIALKGGKK